MIKRLLHRLLRRLAERRAYVALSTLDDRMLRDIGFTRDLWTGAIRPY
jgi:uncharacterized protein YjiS (DUF1127 family)